MTSTVPATDSSNAVFLIYDKYVIQKKNNKKEKKRSLFPELNVLVYLDQVLEGIRKGARRAWVVY